MDRSPSFGRKDSKSSKQAEESRVVALQQWAHQIAGHLVKHGLLCKKRKLMKRWTPRYYVLSDSGILTHFTETSDRETVLSLVELCLAPPPVEILGAYQVPAPNNFADGLAKICALPLEKLPEIGGELELPAGLEVTTGTAELRFMLTLKLPDRDLELLCESEQEVRSWRSALAETCRPQRRASVVQRTQRVPDSLQLDVQTVTDVFEGFLHKQGKMSRGWKMRYFILAHHHLYYFAEKVEWKSLRMTGPNEALPSMLGAIDLNECGLRLSPQKRLTDSSPSDCAFQIESPERIYYLCAQTTDLRQLWMDELARAILRASEERKSPAEAQPSSTQGRPRGEVSGPGLPFLEARSRSPSPGPSRFSPNVVLAAGDAVNPQAAKISIVGMSVVTTSQPPFTAYTIISVIPGRPHLPLLVSRRYSDFLTLDTVLDRDFPAEMAKNNLPPKRPFNFQNTSQDFVDRRRMLLERYLNALCAWPAVLHSEPVLTFLSPNKRYVKAGFLRDIEQNGSQQGYLLKLGCFDGKLWRRQYFVVRDGIMYFSPKRGAEYPNFSLTVSVGVIPLASYRVVEDDVPPALIAAHSGLEFRAQSPAAASSANTEAYPEVAALMRPHSFYLQGADGRTFCFCAESKLEKVEWLASLKKTAYKPQ
eukprot:TRINITY_DN6283_c0_g1_i1.p1 TRINITY_DN6283_c0_g1~~TRINITY_DN6283_c0_g1_i1.p1  ORF type:complete len:648 (+),score=110.41 TRINITY_DN6283_c0_g1_i1:3-1946(+)